MTENGGGGTQLPDLRDGLSTTWREKAERNVDEWGTQTPAEILLAMQEELGELTQAVLEADYEDEPAKRAEDELDDLGALLFQLDDALADYFYEIHDDRDGELATDGGTAGVRDPYPGDEDLNTEPLNADDSDDDRRDLTGETVRAPAISEGVEFRVVNDLGDELHLKDGTLEYPHVRRECVELVEDETEVEA